jgi:hypothetical protein
MVGGTVIEVAEVPGRPDVLYVDCQDTRYRKDTCAILVVKNEDSQQIQIGDSVWWQSSIAYWTPQANRMSAESAKAVGRDKGGVHYDIQIPRVGYSGVKHPMRQS